MSTGSNPFLSFILCGRDDEYLGDFRYRISTSISYLCRSARFIGRLDDIEVVVVDWGGPRPLSEAITLDPVCADHVRFIVVPPQVAATRQVGEQSFNVPAAFNTGIRRAGGRFITIMPADILIPRVALHNILEYVEGKSSQIFEPDRTLLNIEFKSLPRHLAQQQFTPEQWDRHLELHRHEEKFKHHLLPGTAGGVGAIMLPKKIWHEAEAFREEYGGAYGWLDVELSLRITQHYSAADSSNLGIVVFDMWHSPTGEQSGGYNLLRVSPAFDTGNPQWGLGGIQLEKQKPTLFDSGPSTPTSISIRSRGLTRADLAGTGWLAGIWRMIFRRRPLGRAILILLIAKASGNDWACFRALTGLLRYVTPQRYLEFGISHGYTSFLVAEANPTVELYGIDEWLEKADDFTWSKSGIGELADFSVHTHLLRESGFPGHIRFITGDRHTALERLRDSFGGTMSFDLILFRSDMYPERAPALLQEVLPYLTDDGAFLLSGSDPGLFNRCLMVMTETFPNALRFVCRERATAVLIRVDNGSADDNAHEEEIPGRMWRPPVGVSLARRLLPLALSIRHSIRVANRRRSARQHD